MSKYNRELHITNLGSIEHTEIPYTRFTRVIGSDFIYRDFLLAIMASTAKVANDLAIKYAGQDNKVGSSFQEKKIDLPWIIPPEYSYLITGNYTVKYISENIDITWTWEKVTVLLKSVSDEYKVLPAYLPAERIVWFKSRLSNYELAQTPPIIRMLQAASGQYFHIARSTVNNMVTNIVRLSFASGENPPIDQIPMGHASLLTILIHCAVRGEAIDLDALDSIPADEVDAFVEKLKSIADCYPSTEETTYIRLKFGNRSFNMLVPKQAASSIHNALPTIQADLYIEQPFALLSPVQQLELSHYFSDCFKGAVIYSGYGIIEKPYTEITVDRDIDGKIVIDSCYKAGE